MGEAFLTRRGGGIAKLYAAIGVSYPAESVLTCTNESTGKALKATAKDGQGVFAVPEAGRWKVTCTNGNRTAEEAVEIVDEGQFKSVDLSYRYYIFKSGTGFMNGFSAKIEDYLGAATESDATGTEYISIGGTMSTFPTLVVQEGMDMSGYSSANIRLVQTSGSTGVVFGVLDTLLTQSDVYGTLSSALKTESVDVSKLNTEVTLSIDLSNVDTSKALFLAANFVQRQGRVYDIYLE